MENDTCLVEIYISALSTRKLFIDGIQIGGGEEIFSPERVESAFFVDKEDLKKALRMEYRMLLSNNESRRLLLSGFDDDDIKQIEQAMQKSKTTYELDGEKISREQAIYALGRKKYISGITRSAFHRTAIREKDGKQVFFNSSKLFK